MKTNRIFVKLFLSYMVIFILPLVVLASVYRQSSTRIITAQATANIAASVNRGADLLSGHLRDIKSIAESVTYNQTITEFLKNNNLGKKRIYELYLLKDVLGRYRSLNTNIENICIVSHDNRYLLNAGGAVELNNIFFKASLSFTGMTYEEWIEFTSEKLADGFYVFHTTQTDELPRLSYIMRLNSGRYRAPAYLLINLDTKIFKQILEQFNAEKGGVSFIVNGLDEIAYICTDDGDYQKASKVAETYLIDPEGTLNGKYISTEAFDSNGFRLVYLTPRDSVSMEATLYNRQISVYTLLIIGFGLILCYFLVRNKAHALIQIISYLGEQVPMEFAKEHKNEYVYIESAVETLVRTNKEYGNINAEYKQRLRHETFRRLLLGEYSYINQVLYLLEYTNFSPKQYQFAVVTMIDTYDNGGLSGDQISELIQEALPVSVELYTIDNNYIMLCILNQNMTDNGWRETSSNMINRIVKVVGNHFRFCVSKLYNDIAFVHSAYNETLLLMEYMGELGCSNDNILRSENLAHLNPELFFYYPIDMELRLIQAMKTGDMQMLDDVFSSIYQHNFQSRKLSVAMVRQLVFTLKGTIIRCVNSVSELANVDEILENLYQVNTFEKIWGNALLICKRLCNATFLQRSGKEDRLKEEITNFMWDNYMDDSLTLSDLANHVNISERMLYDYIREYFNVSFAKMLEGIRVQKACELMRTNSFTIKDIAKKTGYTNDNTFRAAFKRVMNMTPSEYLSISDS